MILHEKLGADKVIFPSNGHDTHQGLSERGLSFYMLAQAAEVTPVCNVLPANTEDVISIVNIVRETGATFAVKSGGHCTYSSGSNVENGITINLSRLKDIDVSEDRKSVTVGSGCRFGEVYSRLEDFNLGCVGGRVSSVGVGGLVLGGMMYYPKPSTYFSMPTLIDSRTLGGISFFSSERGLACDNVISYEVRKCFLES